MASSVVQILPLPVSNPIRLVITHRTRCAAKALSKIDLPAARLVLSTAVPYMQFKINSYLVDRSVGSRQPHRSAMARNASARLIIRATASMQKPDRPAEYTIIRNRHRCIICTPNRKPGSIHAGPTSILRDKITPVRSIARRLSQNCFRR